MESSEDQPDPQLEEPELESGDYPHGAEIDDDPPGVDEGGLDDDQPGMSEDPPQAD
jgi:hypothetical protein